MSINHRHRKALAPLLLCALTIVFSKSGLGQVGIAWDPSYAAANQVSCGAGGCGPLGFRNQFNPLDFDSTEPNDEQRRILFEYYNANRCQIYSADGISGWDTSCSLNPLQNVARQRASNYNLSTPIGAGTMRVDPFMKRSFRSMGARPESAKTQVMSSPLPKEAAQQQSAVGPTDPIPEDIWPEIDDEPTTNETTVDADEKQQLQYPPPDEYKTVAPEFEWDESLLDDLPELNHGDPGVSTPSGNPLPPTSAEQDDQGAIRRSRKSHFANQPRSDQMPFAGGVVNPLQAAIRLQSAQQPRSAQLPIPRSIASPLQAAIRLQSTGQADRGPVSALQAAIALEAN